LHHAYLFQLTVDAVKVTVLAFRRLILRSIIGMLACLLVLASCGGGGSSSQTPPPPPEVTSVVVSPSSAQVFTGQNQLFTAQVSGTGAFDTNVTWSVNDVSGGNSVVGTIVNGTYTAPAVPPNPNDVMISANSVQTPAVFGVATANVFAPAVLASISPTAASAGETVTLDLENGTGFLSVVFPGANGTSITLPLTLESGNNFAITVPFGAATGNVYIRMTSPTGVITTTNAVAFTRLPNLEVHAANKDLSSGETLQLDWRLLGAITPSVVTWTADSGSINSQGVFQSPTVSSESYSHVTGCIQGTNSCNTVLLRILPFRIEPTSPIVNVGSTVQLSAMQGQSSLSPEWSVLAGGGSVSSGGLFTAPTVAAQAGAIPVSAILGTKSGQASVGVSGAFPGLVNRVYDYANFNKITPAEATFVSSVAVSGNRAYSITTGNPYNLAAAYKAIDVYDITTPDQPVWIDSVEFASSSIFTFAQVFASGNTLFSLDLNNLVTYSIRNQAPTLTAIIPLSSLVNWSFNDGVLCVIGNQPYGITTMPVDTYTMNNGMAVHTHYDLPQPSSGIALSGIAASGNFLYGSFSLSMDGGPPQFTILTYDISQSPPSLVSSVSSASNDGQGTDVDYLYVVGNLLIANSQVYDISTGTPVLVTTIPVTLARVFGVEGSEVLAAGGLLSYGSSSNYVVVNTSSSSSPFVQANVVDFPSGDIFNPTDATWVNNNTFYTADGTGGIAVYDVSAVGGPADTSDQNLFSYTYAQALNQPMLYAASVYGSGAGVLACFDVSNGTPNLLGTLSYANDAAYAVQVLGTTVFLGLANYLKVVDASNPAVPVEIGSVAVPVNALALLGNYLFVGTMDGRLVVFDVTTPASPNQLTSISMPVASAISLSGPLLLVAAGDSGLLVYDISNPSKPVMQSQYLPTGSAPVWDVVVPVTGEAVLAADSDGVVILDLASPSSPQVLSQQQLPFLNPFPAPSTAAGILTAFTLAYQNGLIYVGTGNGGNIFVYDASVPADPRLMALNVVSPYGLDVVSALTPAQNNLYTDVIGQMIQLDNTIPQNSIELFFPPAALSYATQITGGDSPWRPAHRSRLDQGSESLTKNTSSYDRFGRVPQEKEKYFRKRTLPWVR